MGKVLVVLGICLLVISLMLVLGNVREAKAAETASQQILLTLKTAAVSQENAPPSTLVLLEGYCGILSIPSLGLELPVSDTLSYKQLKSTPCRESGSAETGDLVISAHNYPGHFGYLHTLTPGTTALLTEENGVRTYLLQQVRTLKPTDVDAVRSSGCSLVLYTCTPGGKHRVAAYFLEER